MEKVLGQSELDILNTKINYDYFDKYTNYCAKYPNITEAKHKLNGGFWINNISDTLLNALCYVYKRQKDGTLDENSCNYLYYWLGSKVLTNLRLKNFFSEVMNTIYDILSEGERGKVCDPVKYNIRYRNFQKFKDIFDFSEIYNNYRLHFIKVNPSCDKNYDDAIKSYQVLYNSLRNECTIENTNYHEEYCEVFREHFPNEKHSEISSWKCKLQEPEEQDQQLVEEPTDDARKDQMPERPEKIVEQRNHLPGLLQTRQFVEHPSALHPGLHTGNTVMDRPLDHSDNSSPSTITKSVTSAVSAAGVLVPPFLIYNYTPAGTWISKLLGMNKGSNRNPYANQELMENFSMPEDFYSERNRYNIMYNPE
ncbi:PIR protein [Plasmodium vivax]|nr:PIR protein [Plasmodium vivax]